MTIASVKFIVGLALVAGSWAWSWGQPSSIPLNGQNSWGPGTILATTTQKDGDNPYPKRTYTASLTQDGQLVLRQETRGYIDDDMDEGVISSGNYWQSPISPQVHKGYSASLCIANGSVFILMTPPAPPAGAPAKPMPSVASMMVEQIQAPSKVWTLPSYANPQSSDRLELGTDGHLRIRGINPSLPPELDGEKLCLDSGVVPSWDFNNQN